MLTIDEAGFERIAAEEFDRVPERFAKRLKNVALLVEDEPGEEVRKEEGLGPGETLLGLYHGIPATERGDFYSGVMPDTITLFRRPLLAEAGQLLAGRRAGDFDSAVRLAVRETLWHEIGHYFGLDEPHVHEREEAGTNDFRHARSGYAHPGLVNAPGRSIVREALRPPDRLSSLTAHMAKTLAIIFGIILVVLGLLGFTSNPLVGPSALIGANSVLNLVHIILGAILLVVAFWSEKDSGLWLTVVGIIILVIGIIGILTVPSSGGLLLGLAYTNGMTHWLDIISGIIIALIGLTSPKPAKKAALVSSMPQTSEPQGPELSA